MRVAALLGTSSCNFSINKEQPRDWQHFEQKPPWHCQIPPWRPHPGGFKGGNRGFLYYQPKQYIVMREISIKLTIDLYCLIPPKISNLKNPCGKLGKNFRGKQIRKLMTSYLLIFQRRKLLVPLRGGRDHKNDPTGNIYHLHTT